MEQVHTTPDGKARFTGPIHCAKHIIKNEGALSLMRGLTATILREVPQYAVYFPAYEIMLSIFEPGKKRSEMSSNSIFMAGGLAGVAQWVVTYPVDVVKTRIQASAAGGPGGGWMPTAMRIYREGGLMIFYRGVSASCVRALPLHATIFLVYEKVKTALEG